MLGIPDKEIKDTLANADRTMEEFRAVLPRVNRILANVEAITSDLKDIAHEFRTMVVKPRV